MVSSTLPELLDDAAAWRFAQAGVAAVAGLRTGLRGGARDAPRRGDPAALRAIGAAAGAGAPGAGRAGSPSTRRRRCCASAASRSSRDGSSSTRPTRSLRAAELGGAVALKLSGPARPAQERGRRRSSSTCARAAAVIAAPPAPRARSPRGTAARCCVERMAAPGVELIVAARRDAVVPALLVGLGGRLDRAARRRRDRAAAGLGGADRARAAAACAARRCCRGARGRAAGRPRRARALAPRLGERCSSSTSS